MIKWKYENREQGIGNREQGVGEISDFPKPVTCNQKPETLIKYQSIVIEIKTITEREKYERVRDDGVKQTADYAKSCGEKKAHLLIFDRNKSQNWDSNEPNEIVNYDGIDIEIWKLREE